VGYQQRSDCEAGALQDCLLAITRSGASREQASTIGRADTISPCRNLRSGQGNATSLSARSPYFNVDPALFVDGSHHVSDI